MNLHFLYRISENIFKLNWSTQMSYIWYSEMRFFALLGPNGAGKSTTIGIISGLVNKTSGQVTIGWYNLDTAGAKARLGVGVVPQEFNFGIFEKYMISSSLKQDTMELVQQRPSQMQKNIWEHLDSGKEKCGFPDTFRRDETTIDDCSGTRTQSTIIDFDEPTAGVDIELRLGMYDFLRELNASGVTIILTTHYLEEAESLCRNVAIIDQGNIVKYGTIKWLLASMEDEVISIELNKNSHEIISILMCQNIQNILLISQFHRNILSTKH